MLVMETKNGQPTGTRKLMLAAQLRRSKEGLALQLQGTT